MMIANVHDYISCFLLRCQPFVLIRIAKRLCAHKNCQDIDILSIGSSLRGGEEKLLSSPLKFKFHLVRVLFMS
jgi:hypothetical protein